MNPRSILRGSVFLIAVLLSAPLWLLSWLEKRTSKSESLFVLGAQLCALVPGSPGSLIRAAYYWATLDECSWRTRIGFGSFFAHRGGNVGAGVSTGAWCVLGHVHLGAGTRLASRVSVPSGKRQHLDETGAISAGTHFDTVEIGPGCWVGEGAIILAAVGARSIVGAGAVVTRTQPGGVLISGNPATVVRELPAVQPEPN